ncbi:hypothetical protein [Alkalibaculum bacchi]|jgi:hypothetical protein|uniref:hypothetical protein n=1 Tax=Alkalibaculum bacchi TaxID=645887 RepID=UPI0026F01014|nr:hypothetical protein [Alkalibaculum bacchi]
MRTFVLASPKTESSARTISHGPELAHVLNGRLKAMHDGREKMGLDWDERLYVVEVAVL